MPNCKRAKSKQGKSVNQVLRRLRLSWFWELPMAHVSDGGYPSRSPLQESPSFYYKTQTDRSSKRVASRQRASSRHC